MIRFYCIYDEKEVYWDDECQGFRCLDCDKILTEDEVTMLNDGEINE